MVPRSMQGEPEAVRVAPEAHRFQPHGHSLRVAMRTARADLVTARDWIPRRVCPFDGRIDGHYAVPKALYFLKISDAILFPASF